MKSEMKAEEALVMQEEIVFQKDEFLRDQLNEKLGRQEELTAKAKSIAEAAKTQLDILSGQESDLIKSEEALDKESQLADERL